jgi:general secretion pathway protein I
MNSVRQCIYRREWVMTDLQGKGFTLLEVLVALAILSMALVAVFELFSANLKGIAVSDDYVSAVAKAEAKMRAILADDNLQPGSFSETTDDGYTMEATVSETASQRSADLQVRLLEIDLTVSWTRGTKRRSLTLRTMKLVNKQV